MMAVKSRFTQKPNLTSTPEGSTIGGSTGSKPNLPPLNSGGTGASGGTGVSGGTYGANIDTITSTPEGSTIGGSTGSKPNLPPLNSGGNDSTGDNTPTAPSDTEEMGTMTYEEFIAEQKAREEEKRQAALKEAEIYKERAAADAQASYMQNMSTYGVNAETMAQMGLTGGGYSDYLNAQAYAQKRSDMQAADRNELALKQQAETTYGDNIAALNKDLFTYQETQKTNKQTGYNTLLGYAMDVNSGMTEETIRVMAKNIGLSEEEIQSIINTMNTAKGAEVSLDGEETPLVMSDIIKDIQNGAYIKTKEDGTTVPYTWDEINAMLLQARNAGENVTDTDIANAKKAYDAWIAYREGKVSTDEYYNAANGDEKAQGIVNAVVNPEGITAIAEKYGFTSDVIVDIVDTSRDNTSWDIFGKYQGNQKQKD